jgi:hypothetical protein
MFDLLLSADMMLPDPDDMANLLTAKLGIHQHPRWRQAFDNHPYIAHFLRVHKSLAVAPTRVEPQWHLDAPNPGDPFFHDFLESLKDFQGRHRPMLTHAVVLACSRPVFGQLVERLVRRKLPFRLAQRTPEMPFDRLWVGCSPEKPNYDPCVDGGLCIEIMPHEPLQLPPETFASPPPEPVDPAPGDLVRVTARGFLVRDLDETVRKLADNLNWEPAAVEDVASEGYRRAKMGFNLRHSASLDLIQPTRWDSEAGLYLHNWGPGLHYIRLAAMNLDAKADDLKARGVKFSRVEASDAVGGRPLLRIDPAELRGQMFEIEEYRPLS